jgi:hypothetical protein
MVPGFAAIVAKCAANGSTVCFTASARTPKNILAAVPMEHVAADCIGCNIANSSCDAQGAVDLHTNGGCKTPTSSWGMCLGCGQLVCSPICNHKGRTQFERQALFSVAATARGIGPKDAAKLHVLEAAVPVWTANQIFNALTKTSAMVDGVPVINLSKRKIQGYLGSFSILVGPPCEWTIGPGEMPVSFLRKYAVVELANYNGPLPVAAFAARPLAAPIDAAAAGVENPEMAKLRSELEVAKQNLAAEMEKRASYMREKLNDKAALDDVVHRAPDTDQRQRQYMGNGSELGTLAIKQVLDIGKATLLFGPVFGDTSAASKETFVTILPQHCDLSTTKGGKLKKFRITVCQLDPAAAPVVVMHDLDERLGEKFVGFHRLVKQYGSQNLLPTHFYTASDWLALF